ncbi:hypothetical protein [Actinoplanes friuliensis]|uniref:hypothetical protein n=1 Tax=Actinoplanes friuliensis TaxID=196914 RepID=UPI00059FD583|nr:hypothetical protein [Actinoplanes friuliensis]
MTRAAVITAAAAAVGGTTYRLVARRRQGPPGPGRRHVITVHRPLDELAEVLPEPLAAYHGALEVQLRAAPAGRGTEISARALNDSVSDGDIRRLLRESRSLLEVGDILQPGGPTTTPTVTNAPLRAATRHGREGGLL